MASILKNADGGNHHNDEEEKSPQFQNSNNLSVFPQSRGGGGNSPRRTAGSLSRKKEVSKSFVAQEDRRKSHMPSIGVGTGANLKQKLGDSKKS